MKILYISPENSVGTLNLWKQAHEARGNECTFITLFPSKHKYDPGICLNLPLIKTCPWYMQSRHRYYQLVRDGAGDYQEREGYPPVWTPNSKLECWYFQFRDWLWHFKVEPTIEKYNLLDYDIYHFEWGLDLYRDSRFAKKIAELGKPIICTYHGQDMRTRGVISEMDRLSQLNLTSELDLLKKHPNLKYLFLPCDTSQNKPQKKINNPIKICHSPTNRYYKGSESIIPICMELAKRADVEFVLIENKPYEETRKIKQSCDILVDQIYNRGGWGYGMNSIEAMSMGLCCVTELVQEYKDFIPDHPFVDVTYDTLRETLEKLIDTPKQVLNYKEKSHKWIVKYHDLHNTADVLYHYYEDNGII